MMLMEPTTSPYDWNFQILGFPVRVAWPFWALAAIWGYEQCYYFDMVAEQSGMGSPGLGVLLLLWIASMFVSILVHELGHAFAFRYFGVDSRVVLYHLGGLAIPTGSFGMGRSRRRMTQKAEIIVSAAGPAAQIVLTLIATLLALAAGLQTNTGIEQWLIDREIISTDRLVPTRNVAIWATTYFFISFNWWWAMINLVPVLPLDGGQIARNVIGIFQGDSGWVQATWLSVIVGIGFGLYSLQTGDRFLGMMFIFLGISNLQSTQSGMPGGRPW
jgi:stage IV sporulation protein FB